jgi:hypothetical protein
MVGMSTGAGKGFKGQVTRKSVKAGLSLPEKGVKIRLSFREAII